jgi:hypothetical protein
MRASHSRAHMLLPTKTDRFGGLPLDQGLPQRVTLRCGISQIKIKGPCADD